MQSGKRKMKQIAVIFHFPLSVFLKTFLAVDRRRNDDGNADQHRTDDNSERGILVFFNLFANRKRRYFVHYKKADGKENQTNDDKDQSCNQHFEQLVNFDNKSQHIQHLFSSTKSAAEEKRRSKS